MQLSEINNRKMKKDFLCVTMDLWLIWLCQNNVYGRMILTDEYEWKTTNGPVTEETFASVHKGLIWT